jgi:hypothetical protein
MTDEPNVQTVEAEASESPPVPQADDEPDGAPEVTASETSEDIGPSEPETLELGSVEPPAQSQSAEATPPSGPTPELPPVPEVTDAAPLMTEPPVESQVVDLLVLHGTYHGDGCTDRSARKYPKDIGFGYDSFHPAMPGEVVKALTKEAARPLLASKCFKVAS